MSPLLKEIIYWLAILLVCMIGWWLFVIIGIAVGVAIFRPRGLLICAILLDSYYGVLGSTPYLTLGALLVFVAEDWLRPRLRAYTVPV